MLPGRRHHQASTASLCLQTTRCCHRMENEKRVQNRPLGHWRRPPRPEFQLGNHTSRPFPSHGFVSKCGLAPTRLCRDQARGGEGCSDGPSSKSSDPLMSSLPSPPRCRADEGRSEHTCTIKVKAAARVFTSTAHIRPLCCSFASGMSRRCWI